MQFDYHRQLFFNAMIGMTQRRLAYNSEVFASGAEGLLLTLKLVLSKTFRSKTKLNET